MVFRIDPLMGVQSYKTYSIHQPVSAHTRIGTCQAANCPNYNQGWKTLIDLDTPLGQEQWAYIRTCGKQFTEHQEGRRVVFVFEAGQQCFTEHHVQDRPQLFAVRDGDWRGNPSGRRRLHTTAEFWQEDFAEHQAKLADEIEKG